MLKDEFRPIDGKVLTIGRSPKEKIYMVPKAVFDLPKKERAEKLVNSTFARVTYTEAIELLKKSGQNFEYAPEWGIDLQTEHERFLSEKVFNGPVFVTDYPQEIKAFYMKLNEDGKTVRAMDMLVPGIGELI